MNIKIIIPFVSVILALSACGGSKTTTETPLTETNYKLRHATDSHALETTIKKLMLETYGKITPPIIMYNLAEATTQSNASNASSTNTQEAGVDEADRLKKEGSYLYVASLTTPSINVYSTQNGTKNAVLTATVPIANKDSSAISGLYLANKKLVALSGNKDYFSQRWFDPSFWSDRTTELAIFDVNDGKLDKDIHITFDGQLISSRRIGSTLYLATRHTPTLNGLILYPEDKEQVAKNRALIEAATLSDFLPDYSFNKTDKGDMLAPSNCFTNEYTEDTNQQASIINVVTIDLDNTSAKPKGRCFIGSAEALYMSAKSLYLATTQTNYQNENGKAFYTATTATDIHKFSLNRGDISYKGSAQVAGHLGWKQASKSFRMGEFGSNDVLGIITYTGNEPSTIKSPARFFTLAEDNSKEHSLKILAQLPNDKHPEALGKPGEQIYATRFFGNRAYLVTFRTTDPLYILDLSDPADPFVVGELEISGYSDYLHPIGENLVLGIGKDAIPASTEQGDARGAWYQGVKFSLIDVSNPANPYERYQQIIGKRGSNTAVSFSHHAFTSRLHSSGDLRVALPISVHINQSTSENDTRSTHHEWQYDALFRYDITASGDVYPLEKITTINTSTEKHSQYWQDDRSVIIGDKVYYLHRDKIISRDW
ncbi:MAG: beta-propeller domain-containing protein [Cocleimonas sp.]|nr:beta-propeller domain-containing protein [Cocleimonas sp.]